MVYIDRIARRIRSEVDPGALPDADTDELFRSYAVIALAKGEAVTARDVHNAWVAWMLGRGENHPAMVPFEDLSPTEQSADAPFVDAIKRASQGLSRNLQ
jgi:hypothetical protein